MPISEKRLAANRANAAKSTGPRTPEGKARSACNSRKHGFTASTFTVVRLEDLNEVANLTHDLNTVYQPVNSQEQLALERMALTQQSMLRAARLESGLFTACLDGALNGAGTPFIAMCPELAGGSLLDGEITRPQNLNYGLAENFQRMTRQANGWALFLRYQSQAERLYRRAVEEFDRLKALRPELRNEAIEDIQPEENETPSGPAAEPIRSSTQSQTPEFQHPEPSQIAEPTPGPPADPPIGIPDKRATPAAYQISPPPYRPHPVTGKLSMSKQTLAGAPSYLRVSPLPEIPSIPGGSEAGSFLAQAMQQENR